MQKKIEYSTGLHRKDTSWAAKKTSWVSFCERLKSPHTGQELYRDYLKLPKPRQDELKDVGGFVGAILASGNRLKKAVLYRTLLTLDIDHMTADQGKTFWAKFRILFEDNAAVLYSTRKHSTETPRYRLILPFSRNVTPEEYPAIGRMVAKTLGIDQFDTTTYQAERLMYWPSICKDGAYYYKVQEGEFLNPDEILQQYIGDPEEGSGWRDVSQWPVGARETKELKRATGLIGDPTAKHGIIGAFNTAYNIHEAIERFLPAAYIPTAEGGDRYTYSQGSTSGGLVVYDFEHLHAVFAYSHHGTDPVSGKLVNAFDLVRLHKFGELDKEAEARAGGVDFEWDITKTASYKAMIEYAGLDAKVRKVIGSQRLQDAQVLFADMPDTIEGFDGIPEELRTEPNGPMTATELDREEAAVDPDDNGEWLEQLDVDKKSGTVRSTINNIYLILENDPKLKGKFLLDDFKQMEIATGRLPWRRVKPTDKWVTDRDESALQLYLEKGYGITGKEKMRAALDTSMIRHTVHPVKEYLKKLQWDGVQRLETVFIDYLGALDTPYVRTVTRKALLACVYRILRPGIKFDNMLVQVGEEGKGKSLILSKLGGEWFSDSITTVQGKEAFEQIQGWWIIEVGELVALNRAEGNAQKLFLSKQQDAYRPAFGRKTAIRPRQCVFFGTTNKLDFLKRVDGNRRFWPVLIYQQEPRLDVDALSKETVDQIWAEAIELFRTGETLKLDKAMYALAKQQQEQHTETDTRLPDLVEYLNKEVPANWYKMSVMERRAFLETDAEEAIYDLKDSFVRDKICFREIWTEFFKGVLKDLDRRQTTVIADMMAAVDTWKKHEHVRIPGLNMQRGFIRLKAANR